MYGAVKAAMSFPAAWRQLDDPVVHVGHVHDLEHLPSFVRKVRRRTSVDTKVRKFPMWARL